MYRKIHNVSQNTQCIAKCTMYAIRINYNDHKIHNVSQNTQCIAKYTMYCKIHNVSQNTQCIAKCTMYVIRIMYNSFKLKNLLNDVKIIFSFDNTKLLVHDMLERIAVAAWKRSFSLNLRGRLVRRPRLKFLCPLFKHILRPKTVYLRGIRIIGIER